MATLTTANLLVKPWDHSITVINGFLHSSRFCHQNLHGCSDQVPQLRAFIDRLLALNAGRWRSGQNFLDAPAIGAIWQNWLLQLPPLPPPGSLAHPLFPPPPIPQLAGSIALATVSSLNSLAPLATSIATSTPPQAAQTPAPAARLVPVLGHSPTSLPRLNRSEHLLSPTS
jgi:hypothetical protein